MSFSHPTSADSASTVRARTIASYVLGIQEILDHTIDYLSDSPYDLTSCTLVATSWVSRAQRHIYRHLDLTPDADSGGDAVEIKLHRLTHTLERAPHLVPLIRDVSVPLNSPILPELACLPLTHLAELRLECTSYPWAAPAQRSTIAPLQTLLRRPSLFRVLLWGYLEPISILDVYFEGCSRNIQQLRLALDNLDAYPEPCAVLEDVPCAPGPKIALAHLSVPRELEGWMRGPRCPFSFAQLKSLEIRASDWAALQDSFALRLPQLEFLWLTPFLFDSQVDLAVFPALKGLNVRLEDAAGLRALTALLARLSPRNDICHLAITFPADPTPHERVCREFDALSAMPRLQSVEIYLQLPVENVIRAYLPRSSDYRLLFVLVSADLLDFDWVTEIYRPSWFRPATIYGLIALYFMIVLTIQAILAVIATKWIVIGRRRGGQYAWDSRSYCQRWQLHLVLRGSSIRASGTAVCSVLSRARHIPFGISVPWVRESERTARYIPEDG
ncbi:hypothetical protein B0H17DRAFT_1338141 [Mycena rosella]|uniref:Uncharacterized protein n=1 Tax=Mycena rosella TaxID=1033263 RepID=A0AAD7CPE5_MYCRO|nr:hypothetical protein B0H17DRAFT_1338141 [Mycena rosella]